MYAEKGNYTIFGMESYEYCESIIRKIYAVTN